MSYNNISRRNVLRLGLGSVILSAVGAAPSFTLAEGAKKIPLFLQMYSVRKDFHADPAKTMEAVAKMGYDGVEYAGYPCSIKELKKLQDDNGLKCTGSHLSRDKIENLETLKQTIEDHLTLGAKFMVCSWMKNDTEQDWIDAAKKFSAAAEVAKQFGLYVGYHAHGHDFNKLANGLTTWEIFGDNSSKDVQLQMDTSNCPDNPYYFIEKYPGRSKTVHLKETGMKVMGEGTIDWKRVFTFCEGAGGVETYTIEHEAQENCLTEVALCEKAYRKIHG